MKAKPPTPITVRLSPDDLKNIAAIRKAFPRFIRTKADAIRHALHETANTERKAS